MYTGLHIEPTSRCTLGCPRCGRTVLLEKFGKKSLPIHDIDIDALDQFIDIPLTEINLCGVYGDPIYHRNFVSLLQLLKTKSQKLSIVTNGGHRTPAWWDQVVNELDSNDKVIFSIDGTPENFTEYRVNGDWASTLRAIKTCVAGSPRTVWKYIPFSFNENNIDQAKELALNLGIDEFKISFSDRWEHNDRLRPSNKELLGVRTDIRESLKTNFNHEIEIDPLCKSQNEHYVNAAGYYMPCCYVGDHRFYYKSEWWKNKDRYNIKTTKLSDQLSSFDAFYKKIPISKPDYCIFNCGKC